MNVMSVNPDKLVGAISALTVLLAAAAIALHSPGQMSMDTSVQLYEASIGQSVSWNPPFMSAVMRWLGGGELAAAGLVLLSSSLTYLSLGHVATNALRARMALGHGQLAVWRGLLCIVLLLNPVIFIYVGIVWKDVFFSSVLTAAVAVSFAAAVSPARRAVLLGALAMVLLAASMKIRQQGVFMAPVLGLLPLIAVLSQRGWTSHRRAAAGLALVLVFLFSAATFNTLVSRTIAGSGDKSSSVGFRSIMRFDIAGTVALTETEIAALPVRITEAQRLAVRQSYTSARVDYLAASPVASGWLNGFSGDALKQAWRALATQETNAFLRHKLATYKTVLDVGGVDGCIPVHIGVDGNNEYLQAVGIVPARDSRDLFVYGLASKYFDWPIYRHWFYVLGLLAATVVIVLVGLPPRFKAMCLVTALATVLFYASYLPATIACDFRYMYSGIPLVTILWLVAAAGAFPRHKNPVPRNGDREARPAGQAL